MPREAGEEGLIHALKRNGVGARVLVALLAMGPSTVGEIALAIGSPRDNVRNAIRGRHPRCKPAHCLIGLGLARERLDGGRKRYALTGVGRRWAARVGRGLHREERVVRAYRRGAPAG